MMRSLIPEIIDSDHVKIVPFRWYHPRAMDLRPFDLKTYELVPDFEDNLKYYQNEEHSYTAFLDNKPVCCFGSHILWNGVSESWLLTSYDIEKRPITITRMCRRYFDYVARELRLHRMQITCNTNDLLAMRFAIALKLDKEGVMKKYGPDGSDYAVFARTYDHE